MVQKSPTNDAELEALEEAARASQRGFWADPNPMISGGVQEVQQPISLSSLGRLL